MMSIQQEQDKIFEAGFIKYRLYIIFACIPALVICFYGVDEDNSKQERFFAEGDYQFEYMVRVGGSFYHLGIMVSHWANIAVISLIAIMITWVIHTGLEECYSKKK